ncbi:MAG: glycosyltransferase family 2 protein [Cryomorphaceae bacterium]|nr:MAG: glycosyltransferase family 2 protein [Cryomorphaceae bacterium]
MKVSGFSFIRNAEKFDYPIVEALQSILPLCDDVVVAVGKSNDNTRDLVAAVSPKIRIVDTEWNDALREGGRVLAEETNKALDAVSADSDWALYIQGDEVLHEKDHAAILAAMQRWKDDPGVEGLLFNYRHFYGSYDYVADSRRWYRREIRAVRPEKAIRSYRDAQGFRKNGQKLWVKPVNATVHHYGWVKDPRRQQAKQQEFNKLWHPDHKVKNMVGEAESFDYSGIESLTRFGGSHPAVMNPRLQRLNWKLSLDTEKKKFSLKERFLKWLEDTTGWRAGEYRNYRILR